MRHCHCHFKEQLHKLKAGKLGLLGGVLIVGHLLFHVAECLILPALLVAFNRPEAEAVEELQPLELPTTAIAAPLPEYADLTINFFDSLDYYSTLKL